MREKYLQNSLISKINTKPVNQTFQVFFLRKISLTCCLQIKKKYWEGRSISMQNQQIKQSNAAVAASNSNNSSNASLNSKLPPSRSNSLSRNKNVPELVRMLHKTKLTYSHDFESENNYAWNANFLAENFDPHDPGTIQIAYWILKTMTFKVSNTGWWNEWLRGTR